MLSKVKPTELYEVLLGFSLESKKNLEGRILTIVDSSFTDKTQREAVKSLVRNALWDMNIAGPIKQIITQYAERNDIKIEESFSDPRTVPTSGTRSWFPNK